MTVGKQQPRQRLQKKQKTSNKMIKKKLNTKLNQSLNTKKWKQILSSALVYSPNLLLSTFYLKRYFKSNTKSKKYINTLKLFKKTVQAVTRQNNIVHRSEH